MKISGNFRVAVIVLVVIIPLLVFVILASSCQTVKAGFACEILGLNAEKPDVNDNYETALAKCLTSRGIKMYGTEWCGHCKNQKAMFGNAFQHIDYVECTTNGAACDAAGVKGYPTWVGSDGTTYPGEKSLEDLAELFGC